MVDGLTAEDVAMLAADEQFVENLRTKVSEDEAHLCAKSFRYFVDQAWPTVWPGKTFAGGFHVDAICDHLQAVSDGHIQDLIINVPPRHGKSTFTGVMWPSWTWLENGHAQWLTASHNSDLSIRDAVHSRRLINSQWYDDMRCILYGCDLPMKIDTMKGWMPPIKHRPGCIQDKHWVLTSDQNVKSRYENNLRGWRIAVSVGRGTGEGGDYLLLDDPHEIGAKESKVIREGVKTWNDSTWSTRRNDAKRSARVIIMQRVHQDDLVGYLTIDDDDSWVHLCLPAEYEKGHAKRSTSIGWSDPRTEEGELLWEEMIDARAIADFKKMGSYAYSALYQQRPTPLEGGIVKRYWLGESQWYRKAPLCSTYLQSWDMTFKGKSKVKKGEVDYVVGQVWGRKGANFYLIAQSRGQMTFTETCTAARILSSQHKRARRKLVEDAANGPAVVDALNKDIGGFITKGVTGDKEARLAAVTPYMEALNVFIPDPTMDGNGWVAEWIEELCMFPNGSHDDQVDATSQALDYLAMNMTSSVAPMGIPKSTPKWKI
jgi:predicted phage terminase large subunit-like protein